MSTEYGNIDAMLESTATGLHPETPEYKDEVATHEEHPDINEESIHPAIELNSPAEKIKKEEPIEEEKSETEKEVDEYGNDKPTPRTYTEEEHKEILNREIRRRVGEKKEQQPTQQQVQQAAATGFEYNENSDMPWQQQLEGFVEQTIVNMNKRQYNQQAQQKEQAAENEFRDKFINGMGRFGDFSEVVSHQPVTEYMTMALRGIKDPAAFIYAASKKSPGELQRISQIGDPYAQIVEMGKLEERMRKLPTSTKAPKPISRTRDDGSMPVETKKKELTIDDMIAQADAKKRAQFSKKRGR